MPRRLIMWASRYVGNRPVVLFTLGLMWTIYGLGILVDRPDRVSLHGHLPEDWFPWYIRGAWWLAPGVYALYCSLRKKCADDATAWGLLILPIWLRLGSFFVTGIADLFHWGPWQDYPRPWSGVVIFTAFWIMLDRCAAGLDRLPVGYPHTNGKRG